MTPAGTLRLPAAIHFGYGARAQLPELLAAHGTRVLAIVDPFLTSTPLFTETLSALQGAGLTVEVYSDIRPELPVASLDTAADFAREYSPDVILAIGGGSALDAAKLVGLLVAHGGSLSRLLRRERGARPDDPRRGRADHRGNRIRGDSRRGRSPTPIAS